MPVEIMELVVKATITEEQIKKSKHPVQQQVQAAIDKQALTEDIIEQVLAILKQENER